MKIVLRFKKMELDVSTSPLRESVMVLARTRISMKLS